VQEALFVTGKDLLVFDRQRKGVHDPLESEREGSSFLRFTSLARRIRNVLEGHTGTAKGG
jgi:hypothetical protein